MKLLKQLWLISEHGNDARDNGYAFFRYMRRKHREIFCVYVGDKKNIRDYKKARHHGMVVQFRSFWHKLCYILADRVITSHVGDSEPWDYQGYRKIKKSIPFLFKKEKIVFLQHGITFNDMGNVYSINHRPVNLFICSTDRERELVKRTLGYNDLNTVITGFSRFDDYHDTKKKKQILLMPTWRFSLGSVSKRMSEGALKRKFIHSSYYKGLRDLIENKSLSELLKKYDYKFVFYPHYEMQMYLECFHNENPRIRFGNIFSDSAHRLLKESSILITDYSSVAFDFGYMNRPVIYYHFDKDNNGIESYSNREFNYETQGFGPVCTTTADVVNSLKKLLTSQCKNPAEYEKRADVEFSLRDCHNCDRIFMETKKL